MHSAHEVKHGTHGMAVMLHGKNDATLTSSVCSGSYISDLLFVSVLAAQSFSCNSELAAPKS